MYTPLIKQQLRSKTLIYKPCALLMGRTGAGKTTVANKLCGTQHKSCAAKGSVTKELYHNDVNYGWNAFSLIDTPGIDSSTETYKHAILLKAGLTATEINTIFVIIKYDNRFEKMVDNYLEVEQPVYKYVKKVIVMISYLDASKDPENDFKEICKSFVEDCPDVSNIIFFSEQSSETEIANLMYSCISNMKREKLEISDDDFHLKFNIYEMKSQMKNSFKEYQTKVHSTLKEYTELIRSVRSESVEDKDEVLHMTIVQFKDDIETIYQEFNQKHGGAMEELEYYTFSIVMQKENVNICDEFVRKVVPLMSYNLFDNMDPRNLIKECPHCGLIWYKTEGCDGSTTCGNRGYYYDVSVKAIWKYVVKRINGKLQWERNSIKKNPLKPDKREAGVNSKGVGCGNNIVWGALPKLDDELILELYKVKTLEEARELIKSENFEKVSQDYKSSIKTEFQS